MKDDAITDPDSRDLDQLFDEAVAHYRTRCLWNLEPQRTPGGMRVIADKLRRHGDMDAWRLAARIRKALGDEDRRWGRRTHRMAWAQAGTSSFTPRPAG